MFLYESNVLKQQWQEIEKDKKSEEFIRYKNGRVDFSQRFEYILEQMNSKRFVYHKKGLRMEVWSAKTGHLLYHGEYNDRRMKDGWGIEYNEESGNVDVEGIWSKGRLIEVIRCFNGDVMTELIRNGQASLDPTKRIPIYVGGFRYDEDNEQFVREGKGCLIDEKTGIATRECEWKDGVEVNGVDLTNGMYDSKLNLCFKSSAIPKLYTLPNLELSINKSMDLKELNMQVTDLTISSNCGNGLKELDLNKYEWLQSIEIGNNCFDSVQTFKIVRLNRLRSLLIGNDSFCELSKFDDCEEMSDVDQIINTMRKVTKSFHILNCDSLRSIQIGERSFSDFAGEFELKNLPQLQSIQIGTIGNESYNFFLSSFVIRGIELILNN